MMAVHQKDCQPEINPLKIAFFKTSKSNKKKGIRMKDRKKFEKRKKFHNRKKKEEAPGNNTPDQQTNRQRDEKEKKRNSR